MIIIIGVLVRFDRENSADRCRGAGTTKSFRFKPVVTRFRDPIFLASPASSETFRTTHILSATRFAQHSSSRVQPPIPVAIPLNRHHNSLFSQSLLYYVRTHACFTILRASGFRNPATRRQTRMWTHTTGKENPTRNHRLYIYI